MGGLICHVFMQASSSVAPIRTWALLNLLAPKVSPIVDNIMMYSDWSRPEEDTAH